MINYKLEITMEARSYQKHKYIKRSFPVKLGKLDISGYGDPYDKNNSIEVLEIHEEPHDVKIKLRYFHEEITVLLNSFTTLKRGGETHIDAYLKIPHTTDLVHTTFYLLTLTMRHPNNFSRNYYQTAILLTCASVLATLSCL